MFRERSRSHGQSELLGRATQLAGAGRHDDAVEFLKRCLALQPDCVEALLTLVQILAHQQRYEEALDACGRVLQIDPGNTSALASLEQILAAPDIPTKAAACKWLPGEAAPSLLRGAVQLAGAGQHDKAVELLNRCLALQPNHVEALLTLVQVLAHQQRYEEALDACGRILEIDPGNSSVLASMKQILPTLVQSQRIDEALKALRRCSAAKPDDANTLLALSKVLTRSRQFGEALDACRRALDVHPDSVPVYDSIYEIWSAAMQRDEFEVTAAQRSPYNGRSYTDFTEVEKSIYSKSSVNLHGGPEAIVSLIRAVEYVVRNGIPGAFVECGVFMGGNIEVMIRALQSLKIDDRDIYLYDTFAGMPQPDPRDDEGLGGALKASWEAHRTDAAGTSGSNWMRATVETVRQRIDPLDYPAERLHFVKGMVEDTIPGVAPESIAILRLDTDFYSSTKHELQHLYPRLTPGGILIIDDYGAIPGARIATDEYGAENGLGWFLHRVDPHVRLVVKPKTS